MGRWTRSRKSSGIVVTRRSTRRRGPSIPAVRPFGRVDVVEPVEGALAELARAYGIATEFWDWRGQQTVVAADTVRAVLRALDVDPSSPEAALATQQDEAWRRMVPACVVGRAGRPTRVDVHVTHESPLRVWIECENGERREDIRQLDNWAPPRRIDDPLGGEAAVELPDHPPPGHPRPRGESPRAE